MVSSHQKSNVMHTGVTDEREGSTIYKELLQTNKISQLEAEKMQFPENEAKVVNGIGPKGRHILGEQGKWPGTQDGSTVRVAGPPRMASAWVAAAEPCMHPAH